MLTMDRRMALMLAILVALLVGAVLGAMTFFASPRTQQRLEALPTWAGPAAGLALGLVGGAICVWTVRRRRARGGAS